MIALPLEGLAAVMVEAALRGCLLVLVAGAALLLIRKRTAAMECAVWGGVLAASLAMPVIQAMTPPIFLRTAAPPPETSAPLVAFAMSEAPTAPIVIAPTAAPIDWLTILYALGVAAGLARLALGFAAGAALRRRSRPARLSAPFEIRESDAVRVPMTFGWPRAFVVLPATWPFWDEHKLKAVLLHEGAHIKRGDFLLNAFANLNAAIFWFSPHAWWLKRRLTDVSEQASDDRALSSFGDGALYADVLLSFAGRRSEPTMALPMARGALSTRIERALDGDRKLTAALGLKAGLLLGAALSAAVYLAAGVSLAEAPAKPAPSVDLRPATPPTPAVAPKPAAAPTPAEAPSPVEAPWPAEAPEPPDAPDAPVTNDWDDVDAALDGDEWEEAKVKDRAAERAHDAAQDALDAFDRDNAKRHWLNRPIGDREAFSNINIRDDGIEFVKNGKHYRITDEEVCDKAHEAFEPVHELAEEQGEIGEEQAKLGEKMREIGARQSEVKVETGQLKAKIRARMAEIDAIASKSRLSQEELGDIQARLGDLQGELGELQGRAAEYRSEFGGAQSELALEMSQLARRQAILGRKQAEASRKADEMLHRLVEKAMAEGRVERVR
jgi:beta-lactamase regulating signal transducer with metallopeptidase domain